MQSVGASAIAGHIYAGIIACPSENQVCDNCIQTLQKSPVCFLLTEISSLQYTACMSFTLFLYFLLLVVVQMLCIWMLHAIQVGGHFNWAAWNCDLHRGYVMEANEEATAAYNRAVISTWNLLFIARVLRSSTSFCNVIFWFIQGIFS
jgi:hypothetical protein